MSDKRAGDKEPEKGVEHPKAGDHAEPSWQEILETLKKEQPKNSSEHLPSVTIDHSNVERKDGKVTSVTYKDGKRRQFEYDADGNLNKVTQPDNTVWQRAAGSDVWQSNTGKKFTGSLSVDDAGVYSFVGQDRVKKSFLTDGTQSTSRGHLDGSNLLSLYDKYQDAIDHDKNGIISKEELNNAQAILTGEKDLRVIGSYNEHVWEQKLRDVHSETAALIGTLRMQFDALKKLSNDQTGFESGITRKDVEKFDGMRKSALNTFTMAETASDFSQSKEKFDAVDTNHDGFLTSGELQKASQSTNFNAAEQAMLKHLSTKVSDIEELSNDEWGDENDGITRKDMAAYFEEHKGSDEFKKSFDVDWSMMSYDGAFDPPNGRHRQEQWGFPVGSDITRPGSAYDLATERNINMHVANFVFGGMAVTGGGLIAALGSGPLGIGLGLATVGLLALETRRQHKEKEASIRSERYDTWRRIAMGK